MILACPAVYVTRCVTWMAAARTGILSCNALFSILVQYGAMSVRTTLAPRPIVKDEEPSVALIIIPGSHSPCEAYLLPIYFLSQNDPNVMRGTKVSWQQPVLNSPD